MADPKQHLAAVLPSRGAAFVVKNRPTPTPGPNELLVEVKAIALNPIDYFQRKMGFPAINYPAIVGSDIAGTIIAVGSGVSSEAPQLGTRVAAYAPSFFKRGAPDYGALQTRVLVPADNAVALPAKMSFNEASVLPMAVQTAWSGWLQMGVLRNTAYRAADKKGVLVWGAGGSVGCAAVQVAKILGFTVYATASQKHHEYLKSLGARRVFAYNDGNAVANVVQAAHEDGVTVDMAYLASGALMPSIKILKALKGAGTAKVAVAPFKFALFWWKIFPRWRQTQVKFVEAPKEPKEIADFFHFVFRVWLKNKLATGEFVASPKIRVVDGGLESVEKAVGEFKSGLSGVKLVLQV